VPSSRAATAKVQSDFMIFIQWEMGAPAR
jgi:hypothetical protein